MKGLRLMFTLLIAMTFAFGTIACEKKEEATTEEPATEEPAKEEAEPAKEEPAAEEPAKEEAAPAEENGTNGAPEEAAESQ